MFGDGRGKPLGQLELSAQSKVDESYKHRRIRDYFDNRQGRFSILEVDSLVLKNSVKKQRDSNALLFGTLLLGHNFIIIAREE